MNRHLILLAPLTIALLTAGCNTPKAMPAMSSSPTAMTTSAMSESAMSKPAMSGAMSSGAMSGTAMSAHGSYVSLADYSASTSMYANTRVVYFFHATWCPDCRAADAALTADPQAIPAQVTIVKVDFDKEIPLRQKYGVTIQHTYVLVDSAGMKVTSWTSTSVADVLARLKG